MIKRSDIVRMAREWIDTPYRHQGRSRRGVDCAGPAAQIGKEIGILSDAEDYLLYSRNPEMFYLKQRMDEKLEKINKDEIKPGDILLFRIERIPQHVAIAADYQLIEGRLSMIHCYDRIGRVVEHRLAQVWLGKLVQAYRIPGIVEDM